MLIHILSVLTEEDILNRSVFIEWMNKWEMFLNFSLIDDLNDFPVVEVLLCLLNIRDLRLDETLGHFWAEEVVFIIFNYRVLALKEDLIEPFSCVVYIILMDLEYFISWIILSGLVLWEVPFHSDLTGKYTPSSKMIVLIQCNKLIINNSSSKITCSLFHTDEWDCVSVKYRHHFNVVIGR